MRHAVAGLFGCAVVVSLGLAVGGERVSAQTGAAHVGLGLVGHTVRLTDSLGATRVCVLQGVHDDELHVACGRSDTQVVDSRDVRRLDIRAHSYALEERHAKTGKIVGIASGAVLGFLVALPRVRAEERSTVALFPERRLVIYSFIGMIVGDITGSQIGHRLPADDWSPRYPAPEAPLGRTP